MASAVGIDPGPIRKQKKSNQQTTELIFGRHTHP